MTKTEMRTKKSEQNSDMDQHVAKIRHQSRSLAGEEINGTAYILLRHGSLTGPMSVEELTIEDGEIVERKVVSPPESPLYAVNNLERIIKLKIFRQEA